jgi:hypothetical protein
MRGELVGLSKTCPGMAKGWRQYVPYRAVRRTGQAQVRIILARPCHNLMVAKCQTVAVTESARQGSLSIRCQARGISNQSNTHITRTCTRTPESRPPGPDGNLVVLWLRIRMRKLIEMAQCRVPRLRVSGVCYANQYKSRYPSSCILVPGTAIRVKAPIRAAYTWYLSGAQMLEGFRAPAKETKKSRESP